MLFENKKFNCPKDPFPSEEGSLTGDSRTEARLCALQAVYEILVTGNLATEVIAEFIAGEVKKRKASKKLFITIVNNVNSDKNRYMEMLKANLGEGWDLNRIGYVEKALIICAISELFNGVDIPVKVILNEYINISKGFWGRDEVNFINGILNNLAHKIRKDEFSTCNNF